ncbi:hypothetical protein B296_00043020 [Ensete ventricosum]|uniref:Uncharacterized protein n=1 Tax=Ensete ventricosum TaxID=4639 RepID=A0A426X1Q4_ENSVE|nr:hypothetical protein B296_00043020 [Ensete ventricosum]
MADLEGVTNLITQLADYSVLRHRSRMPRLVIIVVTTLRYGSRTLGLVVKDGATARHGSKMPRWLGWPTVGEQKLDGTDRNEKVQELVAGSRQQKQVRQLATAWLQQRWPVKDCFGTEETEDDVVLSKEGLVTIEHKDGACPLCCSSAAGLVWASMGDGRRRWTSVPDRSVEERRRLVGDVLTVEIEQRGRE